MDVQVLRAHRIEQWQRLKKLSHTRRLSAEQSDELIVLYQRTANDLANIQAHSPDPVLTAELSMILATARAKISGGFTPTRVALANFLVRMLPAALYQMRNWILAVTFGCLLIATVSGAVFLANPELFTLMGTQAEQETYVNESFAQYYSEHPSASFASLVWTNNAWIAAQAIGFGISGFWPVYILGINSMSIGQAGALMIHHDAADVFFSLILPHGQLELFAIFVAGAAGLRLFWALISPGPLPRARALAHAGRVTFTVVGGLVIALFISGLIEGFVTGSSVLAWWLKILIGTLALAGFVVYYYVLGKRAVAAGHTGDISTQLRSTQMSYSA